VRERKREKRRERERMNYENIPNQTGGPAHG
jgi:hypothetical protein